MSVASEKRAPPWTTRWPAAAILKARHSSMTCSAARSMPLPAACSARPPASTSSSPAGVRRKRRYLSVALPAFSARTFIALRSRARAELGAHVGAVAEALQHRAALPKANDADRGGRRREPVPVAAQVDSEQATHDQAQRGLVRDQQ